MLSEVHVVIVRDWVDYMLVVGALAASLAAALSARSARVASDAAERAARSADAGLSASLRHHADSLMPQYSLECWSVAAADGHAILRVEVRNLGPGALYVSSDAAHPGLGPRSMEILVSGKRAKDDAGTAVRRYDWSAQGPVDRIVGIKLECASDFARDLVRLVVRVEDGVLTVDNVVLDGRRPLRGVRSYGSR